LCAKKEEILPSSLSFFPFFSLLKFYLEAVGSGKIYQRRLGRKNIRKEENFGLIAAALPITKEHKGETLFHILAYAFRHCQVYFNKN
jgi:hypothetical protein